jgi:putative PIN family toxin of toxin-antitoxin system
MVFLQAVGNRTGPAGECLRLVESGTVELCWSDAMVAELRDVFGRPKTRKKFPAIDDETTEAFFAWLAEFGVRIEPVPAVVTLTRDTKDEKYLNLAIAAGAKLVVSRDKDLLNLATGADPDAEAFRTAYPDIVVLDPVAFLRLIRQPTPQDPSASGPTG